MLKELLAEKKSSIINTWIQIIIETYPPETAKFLKLQKDRFSNPVGYTITSNAEKIFDEIITVNNSDSLRSALDEIIKIRAVQQFSPSNAVAFVFSLKKAVLENFQELTEENLLKEFIEFESKIDNLILIAFDRYMLAREKVFQIRLNEIKARSSGINNKGPLIK